MKQTTAVFYLLFIGLLLSILTPKVRAGFGNELLTNIRAIFVQSGNVLGQTTDMYNNGNQQLRKGASWSQTESGTQERFMIRDDMRRATGTFMPPNVPRPSWISVSVYPTRMVRKWITGFPFPTGFRWPTGHPIPSGKHTIFTLEEQITKNGPAAIAAHLTTYQELMQKMYTRRNKIAETGVDVTTIDQYLNSMDKKIAALEKITQNALLALHSVDSSNGQAVSQYVTTWTTQMKSSSQELLAIAKLLNAEFKRKTTGTQ